MRLARGRRKLAGLVVAVLATVSGCAVNELLFGMLSSDYYDGGGVDSLSKQSDYRERVDAWRHAEY